MSSQANNSWRKEPKISFTCPHCNASYDLEFFNAGWDYSIEMRCDSCPTSLYFSSFDKYYARISRRYCGSWNLSSAQEVVAALKPCDCGGQFRYDVPYRCKYCCEPIDINGLTGEIPFGFYRGKGILSHEGFSVISGRRVDGEDIWNQEFFKHYSSLKTFFFGLFYCLKGFIKFCVLLVQSVKK